MILFEKYGQHQPLNRQSERYAREGVRLEPVDARRSGRRLRRCCCARSATLIRDHVFAGASVHGDDTTVPVLAKGKTRTGRLWTYVRDDRPFGGADPPAAVFFYSRDRTGEHPERHLAGYAGILQADAYAGFSRLYTPGRSPGPITEAACWSHGRRKFFVLADIAANARNKALGKQTAISPLALEAVKRIDAIFDIEREINGRRRRRASGRAPRARRAAGRGARSLDARRARQAVAPRRRRQGDGLHAQALGRLRALPRRRPHLPDQQLPPSARCAASRSAESRGCSPVRIAAASGRRRCIR